MSYYIIINRHCGRSIVGISSDKYASVCVCVIYVRTHYRKERKRNQQTDDRWILALGLAIYTRARARQVISYQRVIVLKSSHTCAHTQCECRGRGRNLHYRERYRGDDSGHGVV